MSKAWLRDFSLRFGICVFDVFVSFGFQKSEPENTGCPPDRCLRHAITVITYDKTKHVWSDYFRHCWKRNCLQRLYLKYLVITFLKIKFKSWLMHTIIYSGLQTSMLKSDLCAKKQVLSTNVRNCFFIHKSILNWHLEKPEESFKPWKPRYGFKNESIDFYFCDNDVGSHLFQVMLSSMEQSSPQTSWCFAMSFLTWQNPIMAI